MLSDSIADMIARVKNAQMAGHSHVRVPFSKMKLALANLLKEEGYVGEFEIEGETVATKNLLISLFYDRKQPVITHFRRISKPGLRIYKSTKDLKLTLNGYGVGIISTPQGLMTVRQAKSKRLGGELICELW